MQAQILKAVLTQAILFVSKEKLNLYTYYAICYLKNHVKRQKQNNEFVHPLYNFENKI